MGGASGGGDRGGEEAQALSPRSGDAGEAGPAGTGALCLARSEEQEGGAPQGAGPARLGEVGRPAGVGRSPRGGQGPSLSPLCFPFSFFFFSFLF